MAVPVIFLCLVLQPVARGLDWECKPLKVGAALLDGGWSMDLGLAQIEASPEFSFPLQLVYETSRESQGLFGGQWFCPQLESSLVPKEDGILLWTQPSGGIEIFRPNEDKPGILFSLDGHWQATGTGGKFLLTGNDGWKYAYSRGRLDWVQSPTGRVLEFSWSETIGLALQIRDLVSGLRRTLLTVAYGPGKTAASIQINGQTTQITYSKHGNESLLATVVPQVGPQLRLTYGGESGVLEKLEELDGSAVMKASVFVSDYVSPPDKTSDDSAYRKSSKYYRLKSDPVFTYAYSGTANIRNPVNQIVATTKVGGLITSMTRADARGLVTSKAGGVDTKTYYYKAPGQKYNGKLRRVEADGKNLVEYRYDRRSGVLTETIDQNGFSTFYEYSKTWKPLKAPLMEPKPEKIFRGTRSNPEIIAEFTYNDLGLVTSAKNWFIRKKCV